MLSKKNYLTDIASLVRGMQDKIAKDYVVDKWEKVRELSIDQEKAPLLIDAIVGEEISQIAKFI